mmetsp:Transcript_9987/g.29548  ORF Transcript_9987/g.29548 Transcript_9987/m.29548 type:complete len:262 (-) Transcript_9987:120-905(-)
MGTSTSRYEQTNWDEADGELKSQSETVDVSPPTANFTKLTIHPKVAIPFIGQQLPVVGQLVAAREYEVRDDQGDIVYTTKKAEKLEKGFDLLEPDGDGDVGRVILRVDSTFSNRTWHVFNVDKPCFEGQRPAPGPSEKASAKLYRKATVFFEKGKEHCALVHMFREGEESGDVDTILRVERCNAGMHVKWHFQTMIPGKTEEETKTMPLVGYWKWVGSMVPLAMDDKMEMDLAKGSDKALHVILAVLATIERSSVKAEYTG